MWKLILGPRCSRSERTSRDGLWLFKSVAAESFCAVSLIRPVRGLDDQHRRRVAKR